MALTVTPEDLMATANKVAKNAEDMNALLKQLDGKIETVSASWSGISSNALYNKYVEMRDQMQTFPQIVQAIAQHAQEAAKAYDMTDVELAKAYGG